MTTDRPKLSEIGRLTPDNRVVALIDPQPQVLFGIEMSGGFDRQTSLDRSMPSRLGDWLVGPRHEWDP